MGHALNNVFHVETQCLSFRYTLILWSFVAVLGSFEKETHEVEVRIIAQNVPFDEAVEPQPTLGQLG